MTWRLELGLRRRTCCHGIEMRFYSQKKAATLACVQRTFLCIDGGAWGKGVRRRQARRPFKIRCITDRHLKGLICRGAVAAAKHWGNNLRNPWQPSKAFASAGVDVRLLMKIWIFQGRFYRTNLPGRNSHSDVWLTSSSTLYVLVSVFTTLISGKPLHQLSLDFCETLPPSFQSMQLKTGFEFLPPLRRVVRLPEPLVHLQPAGR